MDLDMGLVSAVVRGGDKAYYEAKKGGIRTGIVRGAAANGWEFIEHCVIETGSVPSVEYFTAKTHIEPIEVEDSIGVYVHEIKQRALWKKLRDKQETAGALIDARKPEDALKIYHEAIVESHKEGLSGSMVQSLWALGDEVIDYYDKVKNGERGVLTPWGTINDTTLGFWPGDFIVFVARMGVGKTFTMLMMARHAWMEGNRVLFVGTEMARLKLAIRLYSIHLRMSYKELRRGQLGEFQEEEFKKGVRELLGEEGLYVVGDDFNAEIVDVEAAIDEVKPGIVFVDGLYLVKNKGHDRHTQVSNTADDLKRLARSKGLPIVGSHQFNREAGENSKQSISASNVGITDVIGWNADAMFALYQTSDMKEDKYMGFKPLKLREGEGKEFMAQWDFENMEFGEVDSRDDFSDDDYNDVPGFVDEDPKGSRPVDEDDQDVLF